MYICILAFIVSVASKIILWSACCSKASRCRSSAGLWRRRVEPNEPHVVAWMERKQKLFLQRRPYFFSVEKSGCGFFPTLRKIGITWEDVDWIKLDPTPGRWYRMTLRGRKAKKTPMHHRTGRKDHFWVMFGSFFIWFFVCRNCQVTTLKCVSTIGSLWQVCGSCWALRCSSGPSTTVVPGSTRYGFRS